MPHMMVCKLGDSGTESLFIDTCPCGMLVSLTHGTNISHIKSTSTLILMHSGIVNRHQLLCDAHTVFEHIGALKLYLYFTHYRPYPLFLFMCLSL